MLNRFDARARASITGYSLRLSRSRISRGQTAVEFAMTSVLFLIMMLVGVQFALIGQTALALSQGASAIARYVAVNEPKGSVSASYSGNPDAGMQAVLSDSLGTNSWADLTVTVNSYKGGTASTTTTTPQQTKDRAVVTLSYNAASKIALPNPFMGLVTFPTTLSASDSELYE
jgi:Flp pilus assembly protein TadG